MEHRKICKQEEEFQREGGIEGKREGMYAWEGSWVMGWRDMSEGK